MLQNVITNNRYTKAQVQAMYIKKLNKLADKVVSNSKYGTKHRIDKILFFKLKHLTSVLNDCTDNKTILLNQLVNVIKG